MMADEKSGSQGQMDTLLIPERVLPHKVKKVKKKTSKKTRGKPR